MIRINTGHCTDTEYRPVARGVEGAAQRPHTHLVPQIDNTKLWGVRTSVCTYIVIHQTYIGLSFHVRYSRICFKINLFSEV